jgi:hypothetical protein
LDPDEVPAVTEEVRWLPASRAELDHVEPTLRDATDAELDERVAKALKHMSPRWKRGLKKADDEGKAAVALATSWLAGKRPKKLSVDDGARLLSLIGASESSYLDALGELLIRQRGLAFAVAVAARMWSLRSESDNPDWPKSEKRAAIYITGIDDDDDHVHDASCSYSKAHFTDYLSRRYRTSRPAECTEMRKAVTALWDTAPPHARAPLAYLTRDRKRAKQSAAELIHAGKSPYPFWACNHLPEILDDYELITELSGGGCTLRYIENVGVAIWPAYVEAIGSRCDATSRARMLGELANFYGPKTALLIAEYEDTKQCAPVVRDYFTRYPELLDKVIGDPELKYHREDLEQLRAQIEQTSDGAGSSRRARGSA